MEGMVDKGALLGEATYMGIVPNRGYVYSWMCLVK